MTEHSVSKANDDATSIVVSPTTPLALDDLFEAEAWAVDGVGPPGRRRLNEAGSVSGAIELIRIILTAADGMYRLLLNHELAQACGIAELLIENPREWRAFCRDPFWSDFKGRKPEVNDASKALRFVLVRIFPVPEMKVGKRASKFYNALAPFVQQRVPVAQIPGKIKSAHGTDTLAKKNAKLKSREGKADAGANGEVLQTKGAASGATKGKIAEGADSQSVTSEPVNAKEYLVFRASLGVKSKEVLSLPMPCEVVLTAKLSSIGENQLAMKLLDVKTTKLQIKEPK